jgi:hypothetical protein
VALIFYLNDYFFNMSISGKTALAFFLAMQFGLIGILADIIIHQRDV